MDPKSPEAAEQISTFYRLINYLDDLLRGYELRGRSVGLYRRQIKTWVRIPLGVNGQWNGSPGPDGIIPEDWLDQIEGLALYLEDKVEEFPAERVADLKQIVDEALTVLAKDKNLPDVLRRYIYDLLASIKMAMAYENMGLAFDYEAAARNLYAAFVAAETKSPENATLWSKLVEKVLGDLVSHGAIGLASGLGTLALTQLG